MLEKWGFDNQSKNNLLMWATPWFILGVVMGIILLFIFPIFIPIVFIAGLGFITIDRVFELIDEGKLW